MKKHLARRLLSLALALIMVLGILPTNLGLSTEAATPAEEATAASLLSQIEAIETGTRYSKYVVHKLPVINDNGTEKVTNGESFFKGLNGGKYIFVNKDPMDGKYYAFDPTNSRQYGRYVLDPVTVQGDQLFDVNPGAVIEFELDTAAKNSSSENDWVYSASPKSSARARFYFKTADGRYVNLVDGSLLKNSDSYKADQANALHLTTAANKVSTTIYVKPANIGDGIHVHNSGVYKDSDRTGLLFSSSTLTAQANYVGHAGTASTAFYLYKERTDRVNVEPLYNALVEAKAYLTNPNPYEATNFAAFLMAVENGIQNYNNYNKASLGTSSVSTGENFVTQFTQLLEEAMTKVKPYDEQINELMIPATQQIASLSEIKEGSYYILGMDRNGFYRSFDPASNGTLTSTCKAFNTLIPIYFNGSQIERTDLVGSETLYAIPSSGYSIQLSDGQYLRLTNNTTATSNQEDVASGKPMAMTFVERVTSLGDNGFTQADKAFLIKSTAEPQIYLCTSNNGNRFHSWRYESPAESKANDEYDKYLFRISDLTLELFKALEYVEPYAGGNADGRYDETVYSEFIVVLKDALKKYRENRSTMTNATLQPDLDRLAAKLKDYARKLTLADSQASYIDIPVEILDFASDKLLFEWYSGSHGARFSLSDRSSASTDVKNNAVLKALVDAIVANTKATAGTNGTNATQGLVEKELVNGRPVYKDYVVGYIAAAILTEWVADSSSSYQSTYENYVTAFDDGLKETEYQDAFWIKLTKLYSDYKKATNDTNRNKVLGSYDETIAQAGSDGLLLWTEVDTAYDLAYYVLSGVWQPMTDVFDDDGRTYNTVVTERDTLRMYYDEATGMYTIDSANRMVYDGYMIYNTVPQINQNRNRFPLMTPIDGLGFEKGGAETDPGTYRADYEGWEPDYAKTNMNYTLHASGSFIYYEDQEQKFEFVGDDDVYFFVNNKLVMDIGGSHGPTGFTLDLRAANADPELALGLEDGGVYSFDMFYAERHTDGSNMKFSTNIKIVSADTMTSKGQYAVKLGGADATDPTTGKGSSLADNTSVWVGDIMAYSFDMTNYRDVPVVNIRMEDPSLGVSLSPTSIDTYEGQVDGQTVISLTNPGADYANGVVTRFENLLLEYRTLDDDSVPASGPVQSPGAGEMLDLITAANTLTEGEKGLAYAALPAGYYRVRVENEEELQALLAAGIPIDCSFSIYGFLRKVKGTVTPYINELTTHCYYPRSKHVDAVYSSVTGKASRMIRVLENANKPQVRKLEVVLDYGKAVSIPLEDILDLVHFEDGSPARVGNVVGFVSTNGANGQLLSKRPVGMFCTETGDTMQKEQGFFTRGGKDLTFTPDQFLNQIHGLFAVIALEDFYYGTETTEKFPYVLAQIALIPAHVMYYETDFAPDIFTLTQVGTGDGWENSKSDGTSARDPYQDYERLNGTVYHTDIAPEYIPAEAFFVDFDGEGYERRYRDNPQYGGYDFDKADAWYSHHVYSTKYNTHTLNAATGTMELTNLTSTDEKGNPLGAWIQTIIPNGAFGSNALRLNAGKGYYAQIRFRVENCASYNKDGNISLFFSNSKDAETTDKNVALDDRRARLTLTHAEVLKGDYMTVKIPLDNTYFSRSDEIDIIRLYIAGYTGIGKPDAKISIDYIYIGPELGMEHDVYSNYLFIGFDNTPADQLRYGSSVYGDKTSGKTYRDLDTAGSWVSTTAGSGTANTIQIKKGLEGDSSNGYIYFEDKLDDSKITDPKATKHFNYIHASTSYTINSTTTTYNLPINYTPTLNDFCQIRIKIENAEVADGQVPGVGLEFKKGYISGKANIDASYLNNGFHTLTFPLDAPHWKKHWIESKTVLQWLHPTIYNIQGKNNATTGAKFIIDYIFIGPEHLLDRVSQQVNPVTQKVNHLFFDFNNDNAAKVRYSEPNYGNAGINYDLVDSWGPGGDWASRSLSSGVLSFTDKNSDSARSSYIYTNDRGLSFTPGKQDSIRFRVKIDNTGWQTVPEGTFDIYVNSRFAPQPGDTSVGVSAPLVVGTYNLKDYVNTGKYHTLTIPLDSENYRLLGNMRELLIGVNRLKGCTISLDWVYVGPLTESNPTSPSLYFGFGDRGSGHWNTDSIRYDSDSYGFLNYDTNRWLSESEAVTSSLTQNIYGWKTAGNENRGDPVKEEIENYVPPFPPTENVSYPKLAVSPKPDTGNLEVVVDVDAGTTADTVAIQTYPSISSPRYYWRHFMQPLNYHPAEDNIVQVRFRTEGLTIKDNFSVKLMYLPTGADAFITSEPLKLAPLMPLNPEEDYVIMTAQLDDTFDNAPAIERLRLVFEGVTAEKGDKILMDYIYAGVGILAPEPVYGYDSSYENDTRLSNGSSAFVKGNGVKIPNGTNTTYTEATFDFKGTGFDIISRTGHDQATIRVEVQNKTTGVVEKRLTVNNKGELELYQIPVVSVQGLPYGEYTVTLWVNKKVESDYEILSRGADFYFDAVRIYDPMNVEQDAPTEGERIAQIAYETDREAYNYIKEIRNLLLTETEFDNLSGETKGAVFIDLKDNSFTAPTENGGNMVASDLLIDKYTTMDIQTYNKVGPKNEVYLAPKQAVAFRIEVDTLQDIASLDIGAKTIVGGTVTMEAGIVVKNETGYEVESQDTFTVGASTALYRALTTSNIKKLTQDGTTTVYLVIFNNTKTANDVSTPATAPVNVLSLTDVKVAYKAHPDTAMGDEITDPEIKPTETEAHSENPDQGDEKPASKSSTVAEPVRFLVDGNTASAAAAFLKAVMETPVLAEGKTIMHSLNLASDITLNYVIPKADLEGYDSFCLECEIPVYLGNRYQGTKTVTIVPVEKEKYYYFTLDGLTAVQMNDTIVARLHMTEGVRNYISEDDVYSIAQYAYTQLNRENVPDGLKTLCADLLRYGKEAQSYKGYRTDHLADANMTETQKTYLSDIDAVTFGNTNRVLDDLDNAPITWAGKSLNLESKVALKFMFDPANYTGELSALRLRVSYEDITGAPKTVTVENAERYTGAKELYVFTLDSLLAAELRSVVSVQVYEGDTPVSCTLQYSADTYGNNKTGKLLELCKALFAYSNSAKNYFA